MEPPSQPLAAKNVQQHQSVPGVGRQQIWDGFGGGREERGEAELQGSGGNKLAAALGLLLFPSLLG